jgi:hypothetical protein
VLVKIEPANSYFPDLTSFYGLKVARRVFRIYEEVKIRIKFRGHVYIKQVVNNDSFENICLISYIEILNVPLYSQISYFSLGKSSEVFIYS